MTKVERNVKGDVVELIIPVKIKTKGDKQKESVGVFLLTAWIGVMLGFIFLDNLFIGIILAAVVTSLFWMYSRDPKPTIVYVNRTQQTIEKDGVKYQYSNSSKIVLSRIFDRVSFSNSSQNTTVATGRITGINISLKTDTILGSPSNRSKGHVKFYSTWKILIRDGDSESEVMKFGRSDDDYRQLLKPDTSPVLGLAYEISEVTELELIDETAEIPISYSDTNKSLQATLVKNGQSKYDGNLPESVKREFDVTQENGTFKITDKDFNLSGSYFIFLLVISFMFGFVLLLFTASLGETPLTDDLELYSFLGFWILVLGLLLIPISNLIRSKNIVFLNSDYIRYEKRGLYKPISVNDINITDLLQLGHFTLMEPCLELVSKYVRIPMFGKFDANERDILDDLIKQILVTV